LSIFWPTRAQDEPKIGQILAFVRNTRKVSDMNTKTSTIEAIRSFALALAEAKPFVIANVLSFGTRAAVDQAITRLVKEGTIERVTRGMYMRPGVDEYVGKVFPSAEEIVAALASETNAVFDVHGALAAVELGLTTQHPMSSKLALSGTRAGLALRALEYLGQREVTMSTLGKVKSKLKKEEFANLSEARGAMSSWLSDQFFYFENSELARVA
jgi:hypothetical protein